MWKLLHDVASLGHRLAAFFRRGRRQRDIDDELAFHLAMREAEHERAGRPPADARQTAVRQFGNVTSLKEQTRDMWRFPSFESLVQDVRYGFRSLRKSPGFSVVAILVLAIGIGANTAIFSLVDAMLLRGLPYPNADRLVLLIGNVQRATVERRGNSYPDYLDWRTKATQFDDMAAVTNFTATVSGEEPERVQAEGVSPSYFSLLGVSPTKGRTFRPDEDVVANRDAVVVLSDGLWRRRFGADPAILDHPIQLGTRTYTVIGIMPPGFTGVTDVAQLWEPFAMSGTPLDARGTRGFQTLARLKNGATVASARAEMDVISRQLAAAYPATNDKRAVDVSPLSVETFGQLRPVVLTLMAAVSFVLLIACANVANLLISRSEVRQREIAVRSALGAGQGRLVRQLVTESCVLALLGAAGGVGLASLAVRTLEATSPITLPSFVNPELNLAVLLFTVAIALVCGLLLGLAPVMHTRLGRLADALKDSTRGGSGGVRTQRLRASLVVAEVALAIVLLVGAGLMIRSVQKLTAIDPGFDPANVLTLNASIPRLPAPPSAPGVATAPTPFVVSHHDLLERLRAVPGVASAALASDLPFGGSSAVFYSAEGDTTTDATTIPRAYTHRVTPEFFQTLHIGVQRGRTFAESEETPDNTSVIVSAALTRRFWPNQDPIGKRIKIGPASGPNPWLTIVGVVADVKYRGLPDNPTADPDLYFPYLDREGQGLLLRTSVDATSVGGAVRAAIRGVNPSIIVFNISPLDSQVAAQTSASMFTTWLLGFFAATALVLSVIGIYGVMSYLVTQRTREFGIRLALGATRGTLVRVVLGHGLRLIAIGGAIGIAATVGLTRVLGTLLYGVTAVDVSSAAAILVLIVVAMIACTVPAFRATRVDPVVALRND